MERPPDGKKSFLTLLHNTTAINDRYSVARNSSDIVDLTTEITGAQSKAKRKADAITAAAATQEDLSGAAEKKAKAFGSDSSMIMEAESYWDKKTRSLI